MTEAQGRIFNCGAVLKDPAHVIRSTIKRTTPSTPTMPPDTATILFSI
jgi:hypothetical protein